MKTRVKILLNLGKYFVMNKILGLILFICSLVTVNAQRGFELDSSKDKVVIPFKLINNLIFIELELNGVEMTFLVDSGVEETILFGLEENKEVELYNAEKISLRGLGSNDFIEAYKSTKNTIKIANHYIDGAHTVLIVLDQGINFSPLIGIPVNGIIGYKFFENYLVGIDYQKSKITVYERSAKNAKIVDDYLPLTITIEAGKPYVKAQLFHDDESPWSKLLVDTGNSDAVWIFENHKGAIALPQPNFDDFLGRGFSGEIYGKRAKIDKFKLGDFSFSNPYAAFPDSLSIKNVNKVRERSGSLGGETLRRFNCIFDYKNNKIYIKKNDNYNDPFLYNMSGLEIHHSGTEWNTDRLLMSNPFVKSGDESHYTEQSLYKYKFELKPVFIVAAVREGSPADKAGIKVGDKVVKINNKYAASMTLQKINSILKEEEGKTVRIQVERKDKIFNFKFVLKNII